MVRIAALAVVALLISLPATAQEKGRSSTAPGTTGQTPGQLQGTPGDAKNLAPGGSTNPPPGQVQKSTPSPKKTK
jgi:hypothetical protein